MTGATDVHFELLLIRNDPPCRKCRKAETVVNEVAAATAGAVVVRIITVRDEEARHYGAVLAPMLVLNGKVLCAGVAPRAAGLAKLVRNELEAGGT